MNNKLKEKYKITFSAPMIKGIESGIFEVDKGNNLNSFLLELGISDTTPYLLILNNKISKLDVILQDGDNVKLHVLLSGG